MSYAQPSPNVTNPRSVLERLLGFFLPAACLSCQGLIDHPETRSLGLCRVCHDSLTHWPETTCRSCGTFLQAADLPDGFRCGACRRDPPPYDRLISSFSYQGPIESVIAGLKFRRLDYLGRQLGEASCATLRREQDAGRLDLQTIDQVTAIPLHGLRHLQRGYNQAWLLARPIAQALGKPLNRLLRRHLLTSSQRRLSRSERLTNLRHAFRPRSRVDLRDQTVLLVDDVITTGATLKAAAHSLRTAGARSVIALTVARTPDHDEVLQLMCHKSDSIWQK